MMRDKILNLLKVLGADKNVKALSLSILLIFLMGSLRPDKPKGMNSIRCRQQRAKWKQSADIVFAGDSRVLMGVSPAEMQKVLGGYTILNYSQAGVWYSEKYLEAIEKILDPNSNRKIIVLGISPRSLTEGIRDNPGEFIDTAEWNEKDIKVYGFFTPGSEEMVEVESGLDSFDQADFVEKFEKSGALQLSNDLAKLIQKAEER